MTQNVSEEEKTKMMQGIILRTKFIDEEINEYSLKQGIHQIVILGAGMDCRGSSTL